MKKWIMLIFIFLSFAKITIYAQGFNFSWNIGNAKIYYDAINADYNYDVDLGQFYFINNRFFMGLNIFSFYGIPYGNANRYLILPLEIAFLPLNFKNSIFLSVYGRTGWLLTHHANDNRFNNELYGAIGIKFFVLPEIKYHYSSYFSLFVEYDTHNKLKFGASIDVAALVLVLLGAFANSELTRYEQQNPTYR
jgi:hypothetical protein